LETSYQKFARDVIVIGITNILVGVSALILIPILTKTLGGHGYGIWAQVEVTVQLAVGFVGLGLPFALSRFLPANKNEKDTQDEFYSAFVLITLATLAVSVLLVALASPIATAFFDGATQIVRITGLIILAWSLDTTFLSLLRARREMGTYAIFMLLTRYLEVGIIAWLVYSDYGISSVVYSVLSVRALIFFVLLFFTRSRIGIARPHFFRIREYLNFGLPTISGNVAAWVVASSDRYVIGYFHGAGFVGTYSAAYNLGSITFIVANVMSFVLPPTLSKLYDENRMNEVKTYLSYSLKYLLAVCIPFVFGAALLGEQVLAVFSTQDIASDGRHVVPLVALASMLWAIGVAPSLILTLARKTRIIAIAWGASALVNLVLNILIVPHIEIIGAAITTICAYCLASGLRWYYASKEFKFQIGWDFILKSLVASSVMSLVVWGIDPQGWPATIATVVAGAVIYGLVLVLLRGFKKEEFALFWSFFHNGGQDDSPGDAPR